MEQLIKNGTWLHRPEELLPVEFSYLSDNMKEKYVMKVLEMPVDERSTYERVILTMYKKERDFRKESTLVDRYLNEDSKLTSTEVIAEIPDEDELLDYGKEYLEDYLDLIFENQNPRWKTELSFTSAEKFIESTKNYMLVNDLTVAHIKAYKKL
jgi:hypothetical protein